jgi:lipopolysaccharide/colanic/teichoic acid biosynthesis glycosyltransferase
VFIDIVFSAIALIILSPLILFLAIAIKATSKGPILYSHERIGKNGQLFKIIKFRSMQVGAELNGPQLASKDDKRVTPVGGFMRKRRLDEIPNFINVLRGEMSLVGPRPERSFFIKQIIQKAPQYAKLHLIKPGITSWGQVKYGYAENVDEMIKRMRFDLVYIENMSLYVDFQILLKTISTIVKGKGI